MGKPTSRTQEIDLPTGRYTLTITGAGGGWSSTAASTPRAEASGSELVSWPRWLVRLVLCGLLTAVAALLLPIAFRAIGMAEGWGYFFAGCAWMTLYRAWLE